MLRAGLTERLVDRNADQVDQSQAQADCDGCEALRGTTVCGSKNNKQKHEGEHDFGEERGHERIAARGMFSVSVGGEAAQVEATFPLAMRWSVPAPRIAPTTWAPI